MNGDEAGPHPFAQSAQAVLRLAAEETRATMWTVLDSSSRREAETADVVIIPLSSGGTIEFRFAQPPEADQRRAVADAVAAVDSIFKTTRERTRALYDLAYRAARLESELANNKIVERAEGLRSEVAGVNRSERLHKHIEGVLKQRGLTELLEGYVLEVEARLRDRRSIAAAKAALQEAGYTEEEAYRHLRSTSRRLRKSLVEVALSVTGKSA